MAVDYAYAITASSAVTDAKRAEILRRVLQVCEQHTTGRGAVVKATFAANSDSTNPFNIVLGGATPAWGIRITLDTQSTFGYEKSYQLGRGLLQALENEVAGATWNPANNRVYALGTQTYDYVIPYVIA